MRLRFRAQMGLIRAREMFVIVLQPRPYDDRRHPKFRASQNNDPALIR